MSEKKIVVPEGMWEAAIENCLHLPIDGPDGIGALIVECALRAALEWLSENPIIPTDEQVESILSDYADSINNTADATRIVAKEFQRRMFLAPIMEVPKSIATAEEVVRLLEECLMDASSLAGLKLEIERLAHKGVPPMPK